MQPEPEIEVNDSPLISILVSDYLKHLKEKGEKEDSLSAGRRSAISMLEAIDKTLKIEACSGVNSPSLNRFLLLRESDKSTKISQYFQAQMLIDNYNIIRSLLPDEETRGVLRRILDFFKGRLFASEPDRGMVDSKVNAEVEQRQGVVEFRIVRNTPTKVGSGPPISLRLAHELVTLKNIFSTQLPRMPKEYIIRIVFDPNHRTFAMTKGGRIIGGIAFRLFERHHFAEVVFCAVKSDEQVKGYGTLLMNNFKDYVRVETHARHLLTYADNFATGFFKKQGFSSNRRIPKPQWASHIKHYDGSTLMECNLCEGIEYRSIRNTIGALMERRARGKRELRVPMGGCLNKEALVNFLVNEGKFDRARVEEEAKRAVQSEKLNALRSEINRGLTRKIAAVLKAVRNSPESWPFQNPVDHTQVRDYYQHIKNPMDLGTMSRKFGAGKYSDFSAFEYDFKLILSNCSEYNGKDSNYIVLADKMKDVFYKAAGQQFGDENIRAMQQHCDKYSKLV